MNMGPDRHAAAHSWSDGFTLIEVLIAVAILSVGIVLVLQALNGSLIALGAARDDLTMGMAAAHKLDQIRLRDSEPLPARAGSGDMEFLGQNLRWRCEIQTTSAEGIPSPRSISNALHQVSLSFSLGPGRRDISSQTYAWGLR